MADIFFNYCINKASKRLVSLQNEFFRHFIPFLLNSSLRKVKLVTLAEGNLKAHFSIATTPRCREGCYSIPRIAPLYP